MFAQEQADLVGWKWHPGYQSHFETTNGVLIPTCNIWHGTTTAEEMQAAEYCQIEIIKRVDAKNKATMEAHRRLHGS